jgi:hypothetical protein
MLPGRTMACCLVSVMLLAACTADVRPSTSTGWPATSTGGGSSGGTSSGPASTQPMLVDVDTNRTMTATPGEGVGIFTEYAAGGHWHTWWTCDTNQTGADCSFDVTVSTAGGAFTNVAGESLASSDQLLQPAAGQVEVVTQTSTGVSGVSLDTTAGSIVTLDAKMNGTQDGHLLFFVQDSQVNGGYQGTLTDPLMFEPSTP